MNLQAVIDAYMFHVQQSQKVSKESCDDDGYLSPEQARRLIARTHARRARHCELINYNRFSFSTSGTIES